MNGTFVVTYRTTPFSDCVFIQDMKVDGRKSLKNLISDANKLAQSVGADCFKIVKMKGGDWVQPLEDCPLYKVF